MYFAARNYFEPVFVSALHGNTTICRKNKLEVTVSNYSRDISDAILKIVIRDRNDCQVMATGTQCIGAQGDVSVTKIAEFSLGELPDGLYSIEYYLHSDDGKLITKWII